MWRVNGYYAADTAEDARQLGNLIKAAYSGEESKPEPFRMTEYNAIKAVSYTHLSPEDVSGTWLLTEADETLRQSLERYPVGGLIYDSDNIENQEQLSALIEGSQQYMQDRMRCV